MARARETDVPIERFIAVLTVIFLVAVAAGVLMVAHQVETLLP